MPNPQRRSHRPFQLTWSKEPRATRLRQAARRFGSHAKPSESSSERASASGPRGLGRADASGACRAMPGRIAPDAARASEGRRAWRDADESRIADRRILVAPRSPALQAPMPRRDRWRAGRWDLRQRRPRWPGATASRIVAESSRSSELARGRAAAIGRWERVEETGPDRWPLRRRRGSRLSSRRIRAPVARSSADWFLRVPRRLAGSSLVIDARREFRAQACGRAIGRARGLPGSIG